MFAALRRFAPLPRYLVVQVLGLLALLVLRPALASISTPEAYVPHLSGIWLALCAIGYAVTYATRRGLARLRTVQLDDLPEIWLTLTIASWGLGLKALHPLLIGYILLAIYCGIRQRRLYRLSGLHLLFIGFFLASALGLIWANEPKAGWRVLEKQLPLLLLPLSALVMPPRRGRIVSITRWLCRLLFSALTLQIAQYLYLSTFYAQHLWDCLSLNKTYLVPNFWGVVHEMMMLWSPILHPPLWMFFLALPYLLHIHCRQRETIPHEPKHSTSDFLPISELIAYGICLILFGCITQPRYTLWVILVGIVWIPLCRLLERIPRRLAAFGGWLTLSASVIGGITAVLTLVKEDERLAMRDNALTYIREQWPLGGGLGADTQIQRELFGHGHSHNALLTMMVDMGLWGAVVWFALLGAVVWLCVGRRGRRNMPFLLFFFLLLLLLVVDSVLYVGIALPLIALYVCLLGSEAERSPIKP